MYVGNDEKLQFIVSLVLFIKLHFRFLFITCKTCEGTLEHDSIEKLYYATGFESLCV